jgi:hypothetical protein
MTMLRHVTSRPAISAFVAAALGSGALLALPPAGQATDIKAVVAEIKAASERFTDVKMALAEGYIPDPTGACVTAEMEGQPAEKGAMGIHYFRPDLLGITATQPRVDGTGTHTDYLNPGVLIYEPQADGSLELVAVENLVFEKSWKTGNDAPPNSFGFDWYHMVNDPTTEVDEAHGFQPHYELHAWVFRDNPNGPFEPFNPASTCEHHKGGMD